MTKWTTIRDQTGKLLEELKSSSQAVISYNDIVHILEAGQLCTIFHTRLDSAAALRRTIALGFEYAVANSGRDESPQVVGYIHPTTNADCIVEHLIRKKSDDGLSFIEIQTLYEKSRQIPLFIRQAKSLRIEEIKEDLKELKRCHGLDMAVIHGFDYSCSDGKIFEKLKAFAQEIDVKIVCSFTTDSDTAELHDMNPTSSIDLPLKLQPIEDRLQILSV